MCLPGGPGDRDVTAQPQYGPGSDAQESGSPALGWAGLVAAGRCPGLSAAFRPSDLDSWEASRAAGTAVGLELES